VPQPRWVGARRSAKGGRQPEGDERERWKSRGLRVCPAPRSGALAVGGYKRPRGRERKERIQVYNGGCSSVLTCLAEES
jgi:hypothetical protein